MLQNTPGPWRSLERETACVETGKYQSARTVREASGAMPFLVGKISQALLETLTHKIKNIIKSQF